MSDVTQILSQIEDGDATAADQLLPLVYEELRKLAAAKLAQEKPRQTLQALGRPTHIAVPLTLDAQELAAASTAGRRRQPGV